MKIVLDTCAWIEVFTRREKGSKARKVLYKAQRVYTPDIVLAEVTRKYVREGMEQSIVF